MCSHFSYHTPFSLIFADACGSCLARVESKANVADAVSRADLSRVQREGWLRSDYHVEEVTNVMAHAAVDAEYATEGAIDNMFSIFD